MTGARRETLLRWAAAGVYHTGLIRPVAAASGLVTRGGAFQVLTYHRVNDEGDPFFPAVSVPVFERQIAYIARAYRVLTVEELRERLVGGTVPRNALAITFDDGYRDNLTHAAPILARHGLPATLFLATGFIGTSEVPWFDRVALAFKRTNREAFAAPWGETVVLTTRSDRLRVLERAWHHLKGLPEDGFQRTLDGLLVALGVAERTDLPRAMLTWDEVQALTRMGFTIGAHTVTHPILSRVSAERARAEVVNSRMTIASVLGRPPRVFAYPNGGPDDYTETVKNLVREAGFACAVTTRFGVNTRKTCAYELRRGGPWEDHVPTYALKLAWYAAVGGAATYQNGRRQEDAGCSGHEPGVA